MVCKSEWGGNIMIIYKDIITRLKEAGYNSTRIRKEKLLPQSTLQRLRKGEPVDLKTIDVLCKLTGCKVEELIEYIDN